MNNKRILYRKYENTDYEICESLVNGAWKFDDNFKPQELANIAKCMYTKGSVIGSNFRRVVEVDGNVVGFIFGKNEGSVNKLKSILFGLDIMRRIMFVGGMQYAKKKKLYSAINAHQINRYKLVGEGKSEIVLFVVDPKHHGFGYGKQLLSDFIGFCRESDVKSIIVETNKAGASSFYEGVGFKLIGDFDSPLHEYASKDGQACMYEYCCKPKI